MTKSNSWIQTYQGHRFDPLNPDTKDIDPLDIFHALSNICRFTGHCFRFYSVLEHSMRVAALVKPEHKLHALLHDASEAYIADVSRPVKRSAEFAGYRQIEERVQAAIFKRFNLDPHLPEEVKAADKAMLWWEYQALFQHSLPEWDRWREYGEQFPQGSFSGGTWDPEALQPHQINRPWKLFVSLYKEAA